MQQGILTKGIGGFYTVVTETDETYVVRSRKKIKRQHITPLVGDEVVFSPPDSASDEGWLEDILPRRNAFVRPPIANITLLCIVVAPEPQPDWLLVDKLLLCAFDQKIRCVLLVNKSDLADVENLKSETEAYRALCSDVFYYSNYDKTGMEAARRLFLHEKTCFAGQSGVGKTTTINSLFQLQLQTGSLSQKIQRGKNTTRQSELFTTPFGKVFDTPGFSLLDIVPQIEPENLQDYYPEFEVFRADCYFQPCSHRNEPKCEVRQAVIQGELPKNRYERYLRLYEDLEEKRRAKYD